MGGARSGISAPEAAGRRKALIKTGEIGPDSAGISQASRLKWLTALYRPAVPERKFGVRIPAAVPEKSLLGRSQAVRQRILIPPFGGSIPPAPAMPPAQACYAIAMISSS